MWLERSYGEGRYSLSRGRCYERGHSNWWGGKNGGGALGEERNYWEQEPCSFDCRLCFDGLGYCRECRQFCGEDILLGDDGVGRRCDG